MEKMTPDAIALNRPTDGLAVPPSNPPRLRRADAVGTPSSTQSGAQQRRVILTRAVQLQVIPQLLQRSALRGAGPSVSVGAHIDRLAALALQATSHEVVDFVNGLMENGVDAERLYLKLLTPTAVQLGQYWIDDVCSFADVTIGVGHLQTAMRSLHSAFFSDQGQVAPGAPRAMLMPLPGEQHTFGLSMLSAFFTRAGWDTWSGTVADAGELNAMVRGDWIDLIGFSLSHDALLDDARRHIAAIRRASRNPALVIMVGGLPFAQDTSLAQEIGADGTASDGAHAVVIAATLLERRVGLP
jgi:methanogenic corrinoid protein MtbC1